MTNRAASKSESHRTNYLVTIWKREPWPMGKKSRVYGKVVTLVVYQPI